MRHAPQAGEQRRIMSLHSRTFGARLDVALDERGPLCVGIDPHAALLSAWGLPVDVDGLARFTDICLDAFAGSAAVLKPQSAFFEGYGAAGIEVLERAVRDGRAAGALVILDVKRGDIGSTMAAYAQAYLAPDAPLAADAITVSPYLGVGALTPAFELAQSNGAGVFVLAATSNPEGAQVQQAVAESGAGSGSGSGRSVAQLIIDEVAARNHGATPFGSLGVVVGATIEPGLLELGELNGPILAPGVGAQGGTADGVRALFGDALRCLVPNVSREVLRHGPDVAALRSAVDRLSQEFAFLRG